MCVCVLCVSVVLWQAINKIEQPLIQTNIHGQQAAGAETHTKRSQLLEPAEVIDLCCIPHPPRVSPTIGHNFGLRFYSQIVY